MTKRAFHLLSALCLTLASLQAYAEVLPEYTLKAGYLYNFALLTEWPRHDADSTFEMCFYGQEGFEGALDGIRGKQVNGQPINIRHISRPSDATQCELLFVSNIDRAEFALILHEIAGRPVLTVTDDEALAKTGVTIFLRPERQRLVFEVDMNAARSANLGISSRILRLAR